MMKWSASYQKESLRSSLFNLCFSFIRFWKLLSGHICNPSPAPWHTHFFCGTAEREDDRKKRVLFVSSLLQCLQQPDLELGKARSIGTPSWSPRTVVGTQALELSTLLPQVLISRKLASQVESRFQPGTLMWKAGSSSQAKTDARTEHFYLLCF